MIENKEYSPTYTEWVELILLWHRSRAIFANTLAKSRLAWTTKSFVHSHPNAVHRKVYMWLERNLAQDINELSKDQVATEDSDTAEKPYVAAGPGVHRPG